MEAEENSDPRLTFLFLCKTRGRREALLSQLIARSLLGVSKVGIFRGCSTRGELWPLAVWGSLVDVYSSIVSFQRRIPTRCVLSEIFSCQDTTFSLNPFDNHL